MLRSCFSDNVHIKYFSEVYVRNKQKTNSLTRLNKESGEIEKVYLK